jgi:hypothetical protein
MRRRVIGRSGRGETRLESVVPRLSSAAVRDRMAKTARVVFQVSPADKREIQETASGFAMSMSEYLVRVHKLFRQLSGGKTPESMKGGKAV